MGKKGRIKGGKGREKKKRERGNSRKAKNMNTQTNIHPWVQEEVMRILFSILPGIDCNDIKKTLNVFQLISIFARLVPFKSVHGHKHRGKQQGFKEFVSEFMDRCFSIIENSSVELIRQEQSSTDTQMSSEETSVNIGILTCFDSILHQGCINCPTT